jgi:hypothetical protein
MVIWGKQAQKNGVLYNMHKEHCETLALSHEIHEIEKNMETNKKILEKSCQV